MINCMFSKCGVWECGRVGKTENVSKLLASRRASFQALPNCFGGKGLETKLTARPRAKKLGGAYKPDLGVKRGVAYLEFRRERFSMALTWVAVLPGRVPNGAFPGGVFYETGSFKVRFWFNVVN